MSKTEYEIRMSWAELWSDIWSILQDLDIYPSLDGKWFSWIVSQTGFLYMGPYSSVGTGSK